MIKPVYYVNLNAQVSIQMVAGHMWLEWYECMDIDIEKNGCKGLFGLGICALCICALIWHLCLKGWYYYSYRCLSVIGPYIESIIFVFLYVSLKLLGRSCCFNHHSSLFKYCIVCFVIVVVSFFLYVIHVGFSFIGSYVKVSKHKYCWGLAPLGCRI